jgi:hypothetical protein
MSRNPFAFLATLTKEDALLTLLQAAVKKSGGEIRLQVAELTELDTGDALLQYPSDKGDELVVRFARKGATAYFKPEETSSTPEKSRVRAVIPRQQEEPLSRSPIRHSVHDDLELALMEEEREKIMSKRAREQELQRRAESGVYPWETRKPS